MANIQSTQKKIYPALNGLRLFAILVIVLHHTLYSPYFFKENAPYCSWISWVMAFFFILSGFGIAASAKNTEWTFENSTKFYLKRFFRFFPVHFIFLLLYLILLDFEWKRFFVQLVLLQSLFPEKSIYWGYNVPTWYLSTIFLLYLFIPFFVRYLKLSLVISLIIPILFIFTVPEKMQYYIFYISPVSNAFKFILGMALFYFISSVEQPAVPVVQKKILWTVLELAGICGLIVAYKYFPYMLNIMSEHFSGNAVFYLEWNITVIPIVFLMILFSFSCGYVTKFLSTRFMTVLGALSFTIFIIHIFFRDLIIQYDLLKIVPVEWRFESLFCILIVISFILEKFFNKPVTKYLNSLINKLHFEFFRKHAVLIISAVIIGIYLSAIFPRKAEITPIIVKTQKLCCDNTIPGQLSDLSPELIFLHPGKTPSRAIYNLQGYTDKFSCRIKTVQKQGDVIFNFYLDKKLVKSVHLQGKRSQKVNLDCSGKNELMIETDKNGSFYYDGAFIESLKFYSLQ